ncbi:MAG: 3'-5' exoribonuclease, partial [Acidobacteriota bacterium]
MTKTTDSSPVRIMIDLETLSTGPTAAVVQIAAVRFDESGAIASDLEAYVENARFEAGIKISDALQFGNVDGATLSWWLEQSDFARADLVRGRDSLKTALMLFEDWLPEQFELWCHATFD